MIHGSKMDPYLFKTIIKVGVEEEFRAHFYCIMTGVYARISKDPLKSKQDYEKALQNAGTDFDS